MDTTIELITALGDCLRGKGYSHQTAGIGQAECRAVFATESAPPRLACVVAAVPNHIQGLADVGTFVGGIRRGLTKQYVGMPWPRRLGTFTILLVDHHLFELCRGQEDRLIDQDSLHVNVMLGTILVDIEAHQTTSQNTWGLLNDADHFQHIRNAVDGWCTKHRRRGLSAWKVGPTIGAA